MHHSPDRGRGATGARRTTKLMTTALAVALAGTLAGVTAPAAHAAGGGTFSSSFETTDPAATTNVAYGAPSNVTSSVFAPGSVLPSLTAATASSENGSSENAPKAADGDSNTKWLAQATTAWLRYQLSSAKVANAYLMTSANDSEDRDPKSWQVQGSNDGSAWTTLDTQTNQDFPARYQTKTYTFSNTTAYTYYRLNITENSGQPLTQLAGFEPYDSSVAPVASDMKVSVGNGPTSGYNIKNGVGFTGAKALQYQGTQIAADGHSSMVVYDGLDVAIGDDTELAYKIFPTLDASDLTYPSTFTAVDVVLDDGTTASSHDLVDQYGFGSAASAQGSAKALYANQWNAVRVDLSALQGKTIKKVVLTFDNPGGSNGTKFSGWIDDIAVQAAAMIDGSSLTNFVDTRRGTNASGSFSRGNNIPATAVPNGFNFFTPMTDATGSDWLYSYAASNNSSNNPQLQGIAISHEPSPWMGDRDQLAVMPSLATGTPTATPSGRALEFKHSDEVASPELYSVKFTNGIQASVTPTDHAGVYKFQFPASASAGTVIVDQAKAGSKLAVAADGTVSGWVDSGSGLSAGYSRMFVAGKFSATPAAVGMATGSQNTATAAWARFDTSSAKTVELRIATSFISQAQASANLDLEVTGKSFADVQAAAKAEWNDRLGVIDLSGSNATQAQKVTTYSNLYRLNLYPNSQSENTGTAANPVWKYASPVSAKTGSATDTQTNAKVVEGQIYVNNGFWDTYRTAWPLYAFLYPDVAEKLVDGFVQQYRDGGWVARWSSPGYANLMTGTSSDASFAEAYTSGAISTDLALEAYDAAVKNATVQPASASVGRKGLNSSIFLGYTANSTGESVSWGLEGLINDYAIGKMAQKLAADPATPASRVSQLQEEATYFLERSDDFVNLFDPSIDFFQGRTEAGTFAKSAATYNPADWGGDYTETNGWNFAFHAPFDADGLAALYGGKQGLYDKLDEFFSTPEQGTYGIHEAKEARDVRMGMFGMSNQVSHHIPWIYAAAGDPSKTQEKVREVLQRLFVGSEIGQGYPGDEDNGEMSSWQIFASLGFYPLALGSGDYTIGSPLFNKVVVHRDAGHGGDLTINAANNSTKNVYVSSVKLDGAAISSAELSQSALRSAHTLDFTMSPTATTWGDDTSPAQAATPLQDQTKSPYATVKVSDGTSATSLVDDSASTKTTFASSTPAITSTSKAGPSKVVTYTITNGANGADPKAWKLEGSNNGSSWTTLDTRNGQSFTWANQTRPFQVANPGSYSVYRLSITATATADKPQVSEIELLLDPAAQPAQATVYGQLSSAMVDTPSNGPYAVVVGGTQNAADYSATVDFGDGAGPVPATLSGGTRGMTVTANHTFTEPGAQDVTVKLTKTSDSTSSTSKGTVTVSRDDTITAAFNNTCIGDLGVGANCDGLGASYDRAALATSGFVQGQTVTVPGTTLTADIPELVPGGPDNAIGLGQTFGLQLGTGATKISVIGTANEHAIDTAGTLTYSDGSTQSIPIQFGDWVGASGSPAYGNVVVGKISRRLQGTDYEGSNKTTAIFATAPVALETTGGKTPVSFTLPVTGGSLNNGQFHIFALASDGVRKKALVSEAAESTATPDVVIGESGAIPLATVSEGFAASPTATVNWGDGSGMQPATISGGTVSGTHTFSQPGSYTVITTVDDGVKSVTTTRTIAVAADYETTVEASDAVVVAGQSLTVTGTGYKPGETVTVTLKKGSTTAVSGTATVAADRTFTATLAVPAATTDGTYTVTATGAASATPATVDVTVQQHKLATTTSLAVSDEHPTVGGSITLTATVTDGATGTVEFFDGSTSLGSKPVTSSSAEVTVPLTTAGDHAFRAEYSGDDRNEASTGTLTVSVAKLASTVTVAVSTAQAKPGAPVVVTATVSTGATGSVEFFDGATSLGTAAVTDGKASLTVSTLSVGTHEITAKYLGDATHASSQSEAASVTVGKAAVSLSVPVLSASSRVFGASKPVTVSTSVTGASSGTVTFTSGATVLGKASVVGGKATLTLPTTLAVGSYRVVASIPESAAAGSATSTASAPFVVVKAAVKKVKVKAPKKFAKGKKLKVKVKVSKKLTNGLKADGKVKIYVGKKVVKTVSVKKLLKHKGKVVIKAKFLKGKKVKVKARFVPGQKATTAVTTSAKVVVKRR